MPPCATLRWIRIVLVLLGLLLLATAGGPATLRAPLQDLGKLRETLQTQTRFTVRKAVIHGIDLRQAVRTAGLNRGGSTALDILSGPLATQGSTLLLTELVAGAGNLPATGRMAVAAENGLNGRRKVDLTAATTGWAKACAVCSASRCPAVGLVLQQRATAADDGWVHLALPSGACIFPQ